MVFVLVGRVIRNQNVRLFRTVQLSCGGNSERVDSKMKKNEIAEDKGSEKGFSARDREVRTVFRPPDTKKHALEIQKLQSLIHQKEAQFKMLLRSTPTSITIGKLFGSHDKESLMKELTTLKEEREKDFQLRKHLDQELKLLNTQVLCKNDSCSRLKAALRYKTEERIDDAIRRLEHQIAVQQLTIREEKRMVTEIDSLRRSKKTLKEYLESRKVLDELRTRQKTLRANRDACSRKINGCKAKEESIKATLDQLNAQADQSNSQETKQHPVTQKEALKKDIDELYNKKRELTASFNKERNEYYATVKDSRAEAVQQRKIEALKRAEERNAERQVQLDEIRRKQRTVQSAVEEELTLCHNLIGYLEKLLNSASGVICDDGSPMGEIAPFQESSPAVVKEDEQIGQFLRRKSAPDAELVGLYAGLGRKGSKKGRKSRRTSTGQIPRKLVLHPDVIEQLLSLNLNVPGSVTEIPHLLEELKNKQATLKNPVEIDQPSKCGDQNTSSGSADISTTNTGATSVSSHHNISDNTKMDTKPMSPISEENAPDFHDKSSKDDDSLSDSGECQCEENSGIDDGLNDDRTVDGLKPDYSDGADLAGEAHSLEKLPSLVVSFGVCTKSPNLQGDTEAVNVRSKDSNKNFNESKITKFHQKGTVSELVFEHDGNSSAVFNGADEKPLMSDLNSDQEVKRPFKQEPSTVSDEVDLQKSSSLCNSSQKSCANGQVNSIEQRELHPAPFIAPKAETDFEPNCSSCNILLEENGLPVDEKFSQGVGAELRALSCEKCPA